MTIFVLFVLASLLAFQAGQCYRRVRCLPWDRHLLPVFAPPLQQMPSLIPSLVPYP